MFVATFVELVHHLQDRNGTRAPSRQTMRVASNKVGPKCPPKGGRPLFSLLFSTGKVHISERMVVRAVNCIMVVDI